VVNFFGHACIATWYETTPGYVLGAMLPDFAGMLGMQLADCEEPSTARGIRLHHATDAAFHALPDFIGLVSGARQTLESSGLAKGPARAVAHVGIEILIDEVLTADAHARAAYLKALDHALELDSNCVLRSRRGATEELDVRWKRLIQALRGRGMSECARAPEEVAERLTRAVSGHPRLAIDAAAERHVGRWIVNARPLVLGYAGTIMAELRVRLAAAGFPRPSTDRAEAPR
jgi:hypothetical protein